MTDPLSRRVAVAVLATMVTAGCAAPRAGMPGERPMNCESIDAQTMARQIASANAARLYAPSAAARYATRFHIAPPRPAGAQALLLIKSNRVRDLLYRGPLVPEIAVRFDSRLGADGGGDTLTFYLLDPAAGLACAWMNEDGEAYWRDGVQVDIRLLDEGDFGPDGLYRQFDVTLR
jgi:hypothetical protein